MASVQTTLNSLGAREVAALTGSTMVGFQMLNTFKGKLNSRAACCWWMRSIAASPWALTLSRCTLWTATTLATRRCLQKRPTN